MSGRFPDFLTRAEAWSVPVEAVPNAARLVASARRRPTTSPITLGDQYVKRLNGKFRHELLDWEAFDTPSRPRRWSSGRGNTTKPSAFTAIRVVSTTAPGAWQHGAGGPAKLLHPLRAGLTDDRPNRTLGGTRGGRSNHIWAQENRNAPPKRIITREPSPLSVHNMAILTMEADTAIIIEQGD